MPGDVLAFAGMVRVTGIEDPDNPTAVLGAQDFPAEMNRPGCPDCPHLKGGGLLNVFRTREGLYALCGETDTIANGMNVGCKHRPLKACGLQRATAVVDGMAEEVRVLNDDVVRTNVTFHKLKRPVREEELDEILEEELVPIALHIARKTTELLDDEPTGTARVQDIIKKMQLERATPQQRRWLLRQLLELYRTVAQ
ncbi:MAG: hypothetical protein WCS85_05730 [Candidatus Peribacteraceae bacterium]|jgi:hypothetical protein